MAIVSRYTVALHILTFITEKTGNSDAFITSNQIAVSVGTSPVFIRRILGSLAKANLVIVKHGGTDTGWKLARSSDKITLLDVYEAVVQKPLFESHHSKPNTDCVIGRGIQPALHHIYNQSEAAMKQQLRQYSISDLLLETVAQFNLMEAEKRL
ncbi:Rrf2 family transcriptional regulator [Shimazuella alba]|uniref:Transcriptional regulator n=1 Tax=Shimazuella alba TaxID=2690964 RepID=A0A6I4VQZ2_9BACL|nr:Rrf2 family transcriptional regulator [Shimazuella alba]MXQ54067.1 transcriptional regulator [Shimazuella alba]